MPFDRQRPGRVARRVLALCLPLLCLAVWTPSNAVGAATTGTPVMGRTRVSAADLAGWFRSKGKVSLATVDIDALARTFIEEGDAEGVAGDLAFAQSIIETGYFTFSSRTPPSYNNFSGLGAVDGGTGAASFATARTGVRAQIQHLRAYADPTVTTANLAYPLVDPRFHLVLPKGKAPTWDQFGNGIWASDPTYGTKVLALHAQIVAYAGIDAATWLPFSTAEGLAAQAHRDLLAREPAWSETAAGAALLEAGSVTPGGYLAGLVEGEGAEHAQPTVRLYLSGLGRLPDRSGLQYWTRRHAAGDTLVRIAERFLDSAEYERRFGGLSDSAFVAQLYWNVLGREGDPSGVDYWSRRLAGGRIDRTGLLVQFSESPEHIRDGRSEVETSIVYLGMVLRAPDPSVLSWWSTKRATGSALSALTTLVFESTAYQARFS